MHFFFALATRPFKTRLLFLIIFIINSTHGQAQYLNRSLIIGHGISFLTDYYSTNKKLDSSNYHLRAWSPITYTIDTRIILYEVDNNSSISFDIPVSLGTALSSKGFGSIAIPVMLGMNIGNISTFNSDKDKGMVIGLGAEYINSAIFRNDKDKGLKTSWFEPCMNVGYRYWNRRNKAREVNLKIGYNPGQLVKTSKEEMGNTKSFSVRLAYFLYPKY